ncbi:MAG: hypothetical protein NTZ07_00200 [Candidatus Woesebacteria bacterium]|nr:hypothetical protein [Candidatus Woesebacteria bacterium]
MSKLFFDHLIYLEEVEIEIKKTASSKEEREELWGLVDEIVTHKVLGTVLDKLPRAHHEEFLALFHKCPHDEQVIFGYLKEKAGENIEEDLKRDLKNLGIDLLKEIKSLAV